MVHITFIDRVGNSLLNFVFTFGPKLIYAAIVIVLGFLLARLIRKILNKSLSKLSFDLSLRNFLIKTCVYVIKALVLISAVTMLGIPTTGLIATLSAAAVAVSLALKDSLGNIAGGIMLLLSRPFATGDVIGINDKVGSVKFIDMIHTTITTFDNVDIIIPNGKVVNETISNYSKQDFRRMDLQFSISIHEDFEKAKAMISNVVLTHDMTLNEPEPPFIRVGKQTDNSTDIIIRVWCKTDDYWTLHFDLLEQIKTALDNEGMSLPSRQMDVRLLDQK